MYYLMSIQNSTFQDFLEADLTNIEWKSLFSAVIFVVKKLVFLFSCEFDIIQCFVSCVHVYICTDARMYMCPYVLVCVHMSA